MTRSEITQRAAVKMSNAAAVAAFARGMSRWESATAVAVASERTPGPWYIYDLTTGACSCPAAAYRGRCKHGATAEAFARSNEATRPAALALAPEPAWSDDTDVELGAAPVPDDAPPTLVLNARTGGWWAPDWRERLGYTPSATRWPREV